MKLKRVSLLLAAVLILAMSTSAFANANPFADVPAHHWAYDSVTQLAAVGLVEGYPDGTFGGTRTMTRYEASMVFARALARLEALVEDQVISNTAGVKDQITAEVLAELDAMTDELSALIAAEFAELSIAVKEGIGTEPVEIQPVERPFVMTPEAEAVISELVANLTKEHLAQAQELAKETIVETGVIERVVVEDVDEDVIREIAQEVLASSLYAIENQIESNHGFTEMVTTKINDRLGRVTRVVDEIKADYVKQDEVDARFYDLELAVEDNANYVDMVTDRITDRVGRVTRKVDVLTAEHALTVETVNGLIAALEGDTAALQKALDDEVLAIANTFVSVQEEFSEDLARFGVRVDDLELLYASLDGRLADVEDRITALENAEDDISLTGSFKFNSGLTNITTVENDVRVDLPAASGIFKNYADADLSYGGNFDGQVSFAIDEDTKLSFIIGGKASQPANLLLDKYVLEVVTDSLVNRLAVGTIGDDVAPRFDNYALAFKPSKGAVADIGLGGADLYALVAGGSGDGVLALGAEYAVLPEVGFKLTGAVAADNKLNLSEEVTVAAGLFGDIFGLNYDLGVALDRYDDNATDNLLFDVNVGAELGALGVNAGYTFAGENFGNGVLAGTDFFVNGAQSRLRLDADATLFGVELSAGTYTEKDVNSDNVANATMLNAGYNLDIFVPISLSGAYGWRMNEVDPDANHVHTKLAVGTGLELFGVDVDGSFTFVNNYIDGDWRNPSKWAGQDLNLIAVGLGYGSELGNAKLDLGYDFELAMPRNDTADDFGNQMTHLLSAGYLFAPGVKLNMSAQRVNIADVDETIPSINVDEIKAGLEFNF